MPDQPFWTSQVTSGFRFTAGQGAHRALPYVTKVVTMNESVADFEKSDHPVKAAQCKVSRDTYATVNSVELLSSAMLKNIRF